MYLVEQASLLAEKDVATPAKKHSKTKGVNMCYCFFIAQIKVDIHFTTFRGLSCAALCGSTFL